MNNNFKIILIYILMMSVFGYLIYREIKSSTEKFDQTELGTTSASTPSFDESLMVFKNSVTKNVGSKLSVLLFQVVLILLVVRLFSSLFQFIGQPGVIGEIVAGIVLGPSLFGLLFPGAYGFIFPPESLSTLGLLSQIGLVLFMFVIGLELDFRVFKNKFNETLVISHAGIIIPFFLGILAAKWVYVEYAASTTEFLPFALFIGIAMSITAFPVLARILQERNMMKSQAGILSLASAANDDVTAWCLLAAVIAIVKAGSFHSALFTIGVSFIYILFMFLVLRPFLEKNLKNKVKKGHKVLAEILGSKDNLPYNIDNQKDEKLIYSAQNSKPIPNLGENYKFVVDKELLDYNGRAGSKIKLFGKESIIKQLLDRGLDPSFFVNKSYIGLVFIILVLSSVTTEILGIHALFGAFIAGVIMPVNMDLRKIISNKIEDVALVFFMPLFFAYMGLQTQIGLINSPSLWILCGVFVLVAIAGKLGGCSIAAKLSGENWKDSLTIGTLMNTRGLMQLVALNIGYEMGVLPANIFAILIIMSLVTTFMTSPILTVISKLK